MSRFKLEEGSNNLNNPYFYQQQIHTISNLLCSSECSNELAGASQVKDIDFMLMEVSPVRSTMALSVRYAGSDSNGVERVASNACVIVERFYSTNDPTIKITYWDTVFPEPAWRRNLEYWIWRVNREIHGTFR